MFNYIIIYTETNHMVLLLCNIQGVNTTRSQNIQHKFSVSKVYKANLIQIKDHGSELTANKL